MKTPMITVQRLPVVKENSRTAWVRLQNGDIIKRHKTKHAPALRSHQPEITEPVHPTRYTLPEKAFRVIAVVVAVWVVVTTLLILTGYR